ncbi:conserved hypothetical protein [Talaromyces stipitatus ATCC 10500]|uniref:Altered inheritance of mitochondria protein 6 n=1 Tax=Talaromyces stipitatus (strain ATCC 10500 / CBS 375.48 / QM 6759 / NRRL 1006) TaxID=441959 RepID=B8MFG1_TALSN|nr:uncharacterized protein TSTA_017690 [Talaromyces stipitatus ATCC 10500]EED16695.1 conserved hypothetical protein [Talaromyces stipitatus ATCC 10500]
MSEDEVLLRSFSNDDFVDGLAEPLNGSQNLQLTARPPFLSRLPFSSLISNFCIFLINCQHAHCNAQPRSPRAIICRYVKRPFWGLVVLLGLLNVFSIGLNCIYILFPEDFDDQTDAWLLPNNRLAISSDWDRPGTPLSRCHSHNDYWRDVPLKSALLAGCIGVEADIWLSDGDLLVGHNAFVLNRHETLRALYLNPLLDILHQRNTRKNTLNLPDNFDAPFPMAGVFASDPAQTLVLLIDFKTDGDKLWPYVMDQLEPLRESGFLSYFNGTVIHERPITVVATGDAPVHQIIKNDTYRDIFYDAPLDKLPLSPSLNQDSLSPKYDFTNSYYASVNFANAIGGLYRNQFSQDQLTLIRAQIEAAHKRGLKVRYWGTPTWPRGLRNHVWHVLVREGVDLINVDDLTGATRQDWRKHRSWLL